MRIIKILIVAACFNWASFAYADTIVLKNGQSVTGKVLEKTDKYIKLEVEGVGVTYYSDEIEENAPAPSIKAAGDQVNFPGQDNDQDKLIKEVLEEGGIKKQIEDLPGTFISSMVASCEQKNSSQDCLLMKEAATESFRADQFNKTVVDALELNFDKDRLSTMLAFFQSPLSKKITKEGLLSESPEALSEKKDFAHQLMLNPPTAARLALFDRYDKASHTTDLMVEISALMAMDMYEAAKKAEPSSSSKDDSQEKLQLELQLRVQLRQPLRNSSRISFLFDTRHISDDELNTEITFEESETGLWFTKIINQAFVDAMGQAGKNMAARLMSLAKVKSDEIQAKFKSFSNEELYQQAKDLLDAHSGRSQDFQEAVIRLSVLIKRDPHFAKTYVGLARVIVRSGYHNDPKTLQLALQYINKATMLDPNLAEAYHFGGYFEVYAGDLVKAKEMSEKAKALEPLSMEGDLLDGYIAYTEKRYTDAVALEQTALTKAKTDLDRWLVDDELVEAYKQNGQKQEAKDIYTKMITFRPQDAWTQANYAMYLSFCGDWDSAVDWAQKSIALMDNPMAHKAMADAYYRKGWDLYWKKQNYKEGGEDLEKAYAIDPTIKGLNYSLADYYRSINRLQDAVDAYRREIDIDPTNQDAQQQLDRILTTMGAAK